MMQTRHWMYRLRRRLRNLLSGATPAADAWRSAGGPVIVIAPHPDDEIVGCGGTLRRHVVAGDPVTIVYLTRGENSRGFPWLSPEQKRDTREREARASSEILGVRDVLFLDGTDGRLGEPVESAKLIEQLAAIFNEHKP